MNNSQLREVAENMSSLTGLNLKTSIELFRLIELVLIHNVLVKFSTTEDIYNVDVPLLTLGTLKVERLGSGLPVHCTVDFNEEFLTTLSDTINSGNSPLVKELIDSYIEKLELRYNSLL